MPRIVLKDRLPSASSGPHEETLYSSRNLRLIVRSLEAGHSAKEAPSRTFTFLCAINGTPWVSLRGERSDLAPGDSVAIAPGTRFGFGATDASLLVEITAPGPGNESAANGGKLTGPEITRASALSPFSAERFVRHPLLDARELRCDYLLLEAGQSLPPHNLPCDVAFIVREGRISVTMGSEEEEAVPGEVIFVRAGETRGIRAIEKSIVLQAVAPRPGPEMRREVAELVAPEPLRDDD